MLATAAALSACVVSDTYLASPSWADSHASTGDVVIDGSHQGKGGPDGSGNHDDGHVEGDEVDGHTDGPKGPVGQNEGGHGEDGQGKIGGEGQGLNGEGGGAGGARAGGEAGRPVWSREGIPEVELGRLNVVRSPERVIDRAYLEALGSFTSEMADFYSLDLEQMIEVFSLHWNEASFIDSPLQNLALFRDALDGTSVLATVGVETNNDTLLAVFLGTASDKEIPITPQTAYAVSVLLGQPLTAAKAEALAAEAERIRLAILSGHG